MGTGNRSVVAKGYDGEVDYNDATEKNISVWQNFTLIMVVLYTSLHLSKLIELFAKGSGFSYL